MKPFDDYCQLFFEQSHIGFCLIDENFHFIKASPAFCKLVGYQEEELISWTFQEVFHSDDIERDRHLFTRVSQGEVPSFEIDKRCIRHDASVIWIRFSISLLRGQFGEKKGFIVFGKDIIDEKLAEEQLKLQARIQRNALIREVNHRIKNNIQSVIGLLRYQIRHNPELGKPMQKAIERLQTVAIVHGTHGISRLGTCSLVRLVNEICDSAQMWNEDRQIIKLQVLLPKDVNVSESESVPTALMINELIANAIKHGNMRKSPVRVTLNGERSQVTIRVENAASGRDIFRIENGGGVGNGLGLIRALLPPSGGTLAYRSGHGEVMAELVLFSPIVG